MIRKDKETLTQALARLVQVITLILLIHFIQAGLAVAAGILLFLLRLSQPAGII